MRNAIGEPAESLTATLQEGKIPLLSPRLLKTVFAGFMKTAWGICFGVVWLIGFQTVRYFFARVGRGMPVKICYCPKRLFEKRRCPI